MMDEERNGKRMRRLKYLLLGIFMVVSLAGCGKQAQEQNNLSGTLDEIMDQVYENAELDQDFRNSMQDFMRSEILPEDAEYIIGTGDIDYAEAVISAPMINAVAYQCILIRMNEGADMEAAEEKILAAADPRKWVCVEAESTIVENNGDVILFVMGDAANSAALKDSFLQLK